MSFHATKVFHTFEGGAIICHDEASKKRIDNLKNFGFEDETTVVLPGINAKMDEVQAAMGLLQLKYIDTSIEKRKKVAALYRNLLKEVKGICFLNEFEGVKGCYSYFPILVEETEYGMTRDELYEKLKTFDVFGRRYFYPLISQFPTYSGLESAQPGKMPVAEAVTEKVICLPMYSDLDVDSIQKIAEIIQSKK